MRIHDILKKAREIEQNKLNVPGMAGKHINLTLIVGDKLVSGWKVTTKDGYEFLELILSEEESSFNSKKEEVHKEEETVKIPEKPPGVDEPPGPLGPSKASPFSR